MVSRNLWSSLISGHPCRILPLGHNSLDIAHYLNTIAKRVCFSFILKCEIVRKDIIVLSHLILFYVISVK